MADFPGSLFTPRTTENQPGVTYDSTKTKVQFAEDYSLPAAEIAAIEATLGVNPQGDYDTVSDRIAAVSGGSPSGATGDIQFVGDTGEFASNDYFNFSVDGFGEPVLSIGGFDESNVNFIGVIKGPDGPPVDSFGSGGALVIEGGNAGAASSDGGNVNIEGGTAADSIPDGGGNGGGVTIAAAPGGAAGGDGGAIILEAGNAAGGDANGGGVGMIGGTPSGAGLLGTVLMLAGNFTGFMVAGMQLLGLPSDLPAIFNGVLAAFLDTSGLTDNRTYTFPDANGELALANSTAGVGTTPTTSTTQTITHGLGRIPKVIRINGIGTFVANASATPVPFSNGIFCSSGNRCVYMTSALTTGQGPLTSTAFAIYSVTSSGNHTQGVIGNVTATTFDIVWTKTGTVTAQAYMWEAD